MTRILHGWPATDDAVLLISELCTNAVAHSASGRPGGTFTVRAHILDRRYVRAEVEDQGSAWDGNISTAQPPHGLYLLRQLSTTYGTRPGTMAGSHGSPSAIPPPGSSRDHHGRRAHHRPPDPHHRDRAC